MPLGSDKSRASQACRAPLEVPRRNQRFYNAPPREAQQIAQAVSNRSRIWLCTSLRCSNNATLWRSS